jgi:glycosyltransferase involved in cell wall biosynthesis
VKHLENASTDLNRMDFSGTFRQSRETFLKKWKGYYDSRYTHRLTWRSYISGSDAYSRLSCKMLTALDVAGVDLNLAFLEGADRAELDDFRINDMKNRGSDRDRPQVVFAPPPELASADGAYNIGYVSTPYDRFPADWVGEINRMDEVWVPSDFQREAALASGVKREVVVVPFGVDPDYLHPAIKAYPLGDRFTFLAPIEWGPGFASETLLRAFTDEFGEDGNAVLVVMVTSPSPGAEVEQAVEALNLPLDRAPVVFVVDHDVPGYQAGCLYRSADCLVLVQTASDAGLAAAEALSCGVPVIATGWGSVEALLEGEGAFAIDCELVPATAEGLKLAQPDYEHLRRLLRRLHTDIDAAKRGALSASNRITEGLGWDAVAMKIIERLDGIR